MTAFHVGQTGTIGSVRWRIVEGKKSPSDQRLDILCSQFAPVKMDLGFLFADFYAQNERRLAEEGYLSRSVARDAGARYRYFIEGSQLLGWEAASDQLAFERERKRAA